ncbi:MAG: SigE family polymerase sigma factor [Nocardioides sp.]|nr:SigE family polymerase sigma factor [Nocardioides sp.]
MDFEEWAQSGAPRLARFAYVLCGDRAIAEDLTQDVLADAFVKWRRIGGVDNIDAYLRRSLVNRRVSWWRRWGSREVAHSEMPASSVHVAGRDLDLWRACLALPERQRAAVVLRFYEGMDHAGIAEVMGIGESSARGLVSRGVAQLRITMNPAEGQVR